jgi:hypothetical protein
MSFVLVVLAAIWFAGLLAILAAILFVLRAIYRIPIVRKVLRSLEIEIG